MNILSIIILQGVGPDKLMIEVDKPHGCHPYKGNACVRMDVAAGTGEQYCLDNFNVKPSLVVLPNGIKV